MNRNLWVVGLSLFTWGLGEGFFLYFQPLYLQQWGADSIEIGSVLGAAGLMLALSQIPAGIFTDRFGPRALMWSSWIIGILAAWVMALARTLPLFIGGFLLYSLTGFGVIPMNSYITSVREKLSVGRALTLTSGMYSIGSVIGSIAGGQAADRLGLRSVYEIAAVIFIFSTVIILFAEKVLPHPEDLLMKSNKPQSVLHNSRFLLFLGMTFFTMLVLYLPQPLTSNFLMNQQHLSNATIGLLGAVGSLGNAVATLVLGNISPFIGLIIGQLLVSLFVGCFLWGNSAVWFGLGYFFFGGYRLARSMTLAYGRPMVHPNQTGLLFGALETANALAVIAAPVLAGFLYNQNPYLIYQVALVAIVALLLGNSLLMIKVFSKPIQENS